MSVIEGYQFSIELEDRGMGRSLRTLAKEATTLKRIMQANFREAESLGNGYGALSGKLTGINQTIQAYQNAINGAQRDMHNLNSEVEKARKAYEDEKKSIGDINKATDEQKEKLREKQNLYEDENKKLLNLISKQENYRNQISRLRQQYAETERQLRNYNGELSRTRSVMAGMSASISEYNRLLDQQGMKAYATKGKVQTLLQAQKLSGNQYSQEVAQTKKLQSALDSLQREYRANAAELAKNKQEQAGLTSSINKLNSAQRVNKQSVADLQSRYNKLENSNNSLKESQTKLSRTIGETTEDLQKQISATTRASAQSLRFKSAVNSVGTGRFGALTRSINNVDVKLRAATSHTREWANGVRGSLMTVGIGVSAFGAGIGKAVSMSANLQQSWITTKNLLVTGGESVRATTKNVAEMQRNAVTYSKQYGYSQKEIADQYTELVKRGYSAGQSLGSMKTMLQAARASGDDYSDVVKNVSSTLDAFNLRQNKSSEQVIRNSKRVTNAMAYAADMTATDFKGMGEAMSYVSASAHQAGQSVETTTAAVGELSNAGIEGTRAGTGMRKVMNSLLAPTAAAKTELKKYGMSIDDFRTKSGKLKQLPEIMKEINSHTKDLGKADKGAFFKAVFGTTGQQAAMVLAQNSKAMNDLVEAEKKAEKNNYVENLAKRNMASTKMQMKQLQMQAQAFAIQIGNTLLPAVNKVGQAISKWAESSQGKATMKQFADSIKGVGNTVARNAGSIISFLGGFATGLLDVAKGVNILITPLKWLFSGISKLTGHSGNVSRFFGIVVGGITGVIAVLKILHTAISGVNAVRQDLKGLGVIKDTTTQLQEQDRLYQRMIELQERSLQISEAQAKQQGINTESVGRNAGKQEAENLANDINLPGGELTKEAEKTGKDVVIRPALDETRTGRIKRWFTSVLPGFGLTGGIEAGTKTSTGFLSKFRALPELIKGANIFGRIMDIGMSAFAALDMAKGIFQGLTSSKAKNRYKSAGKTAAEGVAWYFGGPLAAQIAGYATDWAYKAVDNFKKGWNGYTKGYKPKGFIATVGWDFKDATRKYNNWIAGIERKHPVIAVGLRWGRGVFNTMFATFKFFARNVHAGLKEMWDTITDLSTGHLSRWKKDVFRDTNDMLKGVKNDWRGFFDWFGKNRTKVSIKKPSKSSSSSRSSNTFKSSGNVKYSKSDIQNLKAMTKAIGSYKSALRGLKSFVKNNDPSKQMNSMVNKMSKSVKGWEKLASPIKKIGDAFKTLSKFAASMAKKDAFAAFSKDLKSMRTSLNKNSKSIIDKINSMGKSLKNNKLEKPLKSLNKELKESTKTWKSFTTPVKTLAKSFQTLQKATKTLAGKQGLESTKKGFSDLDTVLKKQKIGTNLRKLAKDIDKSKVVKQLTTMNSSIKTSAKTWKSLATPITKVSKAFNTLAKSVNTLNGNAGGKKTKGSGLMAVNDNIKTLYNTIKKYPFGKQIANQANIANRAMSGKKTGFVQQFVRETNQMTRAVRSFGRAFDRDWKSAWRGLDAPVSRALRSVSSTVSSRLDDIESKRSSFSSSFLKGWHSWIDDVKSSFRSGFNKLPGYAASAMKDIISRLNKGISGVNKVIGDFGGDKKLSAISYATGTRGGHPGGHMLVNDSSRPHYKELVKFPGRAWQMFEGRNVLIPNAPKGTEVINGEQTYALNSRGLLPRLGVHAYADGTLSDDEQEKLSEEFEKNPTVASKELILKLTNWTSNTPVVSALGQAMAVGFSKGIANVLKDLLGEVKNPVNGDWTPVIKSAAAKMGEHVSDYDIKRILNTIAHESHGDQHITQPGADPDGDGSGPARGLLQFKTMTFNHYKVAGHGNIYSGYDQLLALFNDTNWRGDLRWNGGWGPTGGTKRENGGLMVAEQLYHIAENNKPEMIIPLDINKRPRALNLIDSTLDHMENDGGGTGGLHSRNNTSSEETNSYLKQAVVILGQIAGLNAQQIEAIANINTGTDLKSRRARRSFYNDYGNDQRIADYQSF